MNKSYKIQLYPNQKQQEVINKTIGCCRFIYNQMLNERIEIYEKYKDDKDKLYSYKYKTEKEYKEEFSFLIEASSRALQQSRKNLEIAFKNFFRGIKQGKFIGYPKFKSKKKVKQSYREPQVDNFIQINKNKIKLLKTGWIKFKGLSKDFNGIIKSVTIEKRKDGKYFAFISTEQNYTKRERTSDNIIGIDLGLKEFITCSNGEQIKGIVNKINEIEIKIKKQQKHLSRKILQNKKQKIKDSNRQEKCREKLAKLSQYKKDFQNHFFWHLANKLCSENKSIGVEYLNVSGMKRNRKLSHSIHNISWSDFICKLEQKAEDYDSIIYRINRFFPSSKMCSGCGQIKENLTLADRIYTCECGLIIDRDLNASINIRNFIIKYLSLEYNDYKHGESVRPIEIIYNPGGQFSEKCLQKVA